MPFDANQTSDSGTPGAPAPLFDLAAALERMDGDVGLLNEVIDIFLEDYAGCLEEVRSAAAKGDVKLLQRAVHTVKGAVGNFVSPAATDLARDMEAFCKEGQLDKALPLLEPTIEAVQAVAAGLRNHRRKEAA